MFGAVFIFHHGPSFRVLAHSKKKMQRMCSWSQTGPVKDRRPVKCHSVKLYSNIDVK